MGNKKLEIFDLAKGCTLPPLVPIGSYKFSTFTNSLSTKKALIFFL